MWQGINNITGFKGNKPATVNIAASLPDELNTFYACFKADNTAHTESAHTAAAAASMSSVKPWAHTRPCAQSMRFPASRGFYRHFQSVPLSVCGSLMLQKIHHCAHTKEK